MIIFLLLCSPVLRLLLHFFLSLAHKITANAKYAMKNNWLHCFSYNGFTLNSPRQNICIYIWRLRKHRWRWTFLPRKTDKIICMRTVECSLDLVKFSIWARMSLEITAVITLFISTVITILTLIFKLSILNANGWRSS